MTELLSRLAAMQFSAFVPEYGIVNPDPNSKIEEERYAVFPASALPQFAENAWIVLEDGDLERLGAEDYSAPVEGVGELETVLVTDPAVLIDSGQAIADAAPGSDVVVAEQAPGSDDTTTTSGKKK